MVVSGLAGLQAFARGLHLELPSRSKVHSGGLAGALRDAFAHLCVVLGPGLYLVPHASLHHVLLG